MRPLIALLFMSFSFFIGLGQTVKKSTAPVKKTVVKATITKKQLTHKKPVSADEKIPVRYSVTRKPTPRAGNDQACRLKAFFVNPAGQPVKSNLKITINGDSIFPNLEEEGTFTKYLKPGKYQFKFLVKSWEYVITDSILFKYGEEVIIHVNFEATEQKMPAIHYSLDKPVIYIYSEKKTVINISLNIKGQMLFSYPKYENGWSVIADSSGNIEVNGKKLSYLFWEGSAPINNLIIDKNSGFVTNSDTLVEFFEHSLAKASLSEKEIQDFITYWVPQMKKNRLNYCHFLFSEDYDQIAKMRVEPAPKNCIRVFLVWSEITEEKSRFIKPQTFPTFSRKGFTVIEWGGGEIPNLLN